MERRQFNMAREKTTGFYFKMSPEESDLFERNMARSGIKNKSAFIRKMCIDGHVVNFELPALNEIGKLLRITANNTNQIARRVNSGGNAYREDVAEVNNQLNEIRLGFGRVLDELSDAANPKPGKRFIASPTIDCADYVESIEPPMLEEGA